MKYVFWDYEETDTKYSNYYYIYSRGDASGTLNTDTIIMCINSPQTPEMDVAVKNIVDTIEAAVDLAKKTKGIS